MILHYSFTRAIWWSSSIDLRTNVLKSISVNAWMTSWLELFERETSTEKDARSCRDSFILSLPLWTLRFHRNQILHKGKKIHRFRNFVNAKIFCRHKEVLTRIQVMRTIIVVTRPNTRNRKGKAMEAGRN